MSALVVASQQEQGRGIVDLQCPQVQHTLKYNGWHNSNTSVYIKKHAHTQVYVTHKGTTQDSTVRVHPPTL